MKTHIAILLIGGLLAGCAQQAPSETSEASPKAAKSSTPTSRPSNSTPVEAAKPAAAKPAAAKTVAKTVAKPTSQPSDAVVADRLDPAVYDHFGAGVNKGADPLSLATVTGDTATHSGKKLRLTGKIESVCKKKGCWMVLADGSTKVRVKFRDYGFFMPLDCEGREAVLDGVFDVKEVSVAELRHLLEDAGKPEEAKKIDQPRQEFTIVADGVALKK